MEQLINSMKENNVKVIIAANYFDESKVKKISQKVNATPVIVPLYVNGNEEIDDIFKLYELWVAKLKSAFVESE